MANTAAEIKFPEVGQAVQVRNRLATVRAVEPYDTRGQQGRLHIVEVEYLDDCRYPEAEQVLWEVEATAKVLGSTSLPSVDANNPDNPVAFQSFVNAHRWTRLNRLRESEDIKDEPILGVWNSAIQVHPYQLEPVIRALSMPRVSLLLADGVGLGKTIQAGLVLEELLLRRRIRRVLVLCPAMLQRQWQIELTRKFNLNFEVIDSDSTFHLRRRMGIDTNPWKAFPRIITSMDCLRMPNVLQQFLTASQVGGDDGSGQILAHAPWDLLIVDECHHFAPDPAAEGVGTVALPFPILQGREVLRVVRHVKLGGDVALPFYEGRMIGQFDFCTMSWISGQGSAAVWSDLPFENKAYRPRALIGEHASRTEGNPYKHPKLLFRDIARNTDTRTMISAVVPEVACGHTISTLRLSDNALKRLLYISACMNSFCFDAILRNRSTGTHQSWFIIEECPIARTEPLEQITTHIAVSGARLTFLYRRFAPEWLKLAHEFPDIFGFDPLAPTTNDRPPTTEWKHWWAVTEADRLRLRVEIDALCADLYGLDPEEFDWIVQDDPKDPKGFYRVDRQLPFRERLTGLAAAAFRALKEGRWSAESAASLTNDEFFDLLGIPELTNVAAAEAKGLSGPLILKRNGCHSWHPENFPADDPRHGWTWDDCRKDAITLLGSEEALEQYIARAVDGGRCVVDGEDEPATNHQSPSTNLDLFGNPIPTDLFGNELRPKRKRRGK